MKGLLIQDEIRWHETWSAEIGRRLRVKDSSNNLFIFDEGTSREEILKVLGDAPEACYQLFELEAAPEEDCDFMGDSGACYRKIH